MTKRRELNRVKLNRGKPIFDIDTKLYRLLDVYLEGTLTREEYANRKEQMSREKADAKEKIDQIQMRGSVWLEPARDFIKRANEAEKLLHSDDLKEIRDFLKIAGSNLCLVPPEKYEKQNEDQTRSLPEEEDQEPPEGRSSARRRKSFKRLENQRRIASRRGGVVHRI